VDKDVLHRVEKIETQQNNAESNPSGGPPESAISLYEGREESKKKLNVSKIKT
jgi:hypothetical protein